MKKCQTHSMTDYVCLKRDLCCDEDYNKDKIIDYFINNYKRIYPDDYLGWISNDLCKYIGYKNALINKKDNKGVRLWNEMEKPSANISEDKLRQNLREFPLYFLLSFLGTSCILYAYVE